MAVIVIGKTEPL